MNWLMLLVAVLSVGLCGCDRKSEWASENVQHSLDEISRLLSQVKKNGGNDRIGFSRDDFSNRVHTVISAAIDVENRVQPLRVPLCLEISRNNMLGFDLQVLNRRLKDRMSRNCKCKYEAHLLMFDADQRWMRDRLYFVEGVENEVNVFVVEVDKLNEWWYGGGSNALVALDDKIVDCTGEKIGVFRVCIKNIIDDALRGCKSKDLAQFLRGTGEGTAHIFWEAGPAPLQCGNHVYDRKEFFAWIRKRDCTYRLNLLSASENEWVFIPSMFIKPENSERLDL